MNNRTLLLLPYWRGRNHSLFLGVCDLRQYLCQNGIEAEILDCDVLVFAAEKEHASMTGAVVSAIQSFSPSYIGIHVNTPNYAEALDLAKLSRMAAPEAIIVAGGPHATVAWREILSFHDSFDYVICGEGEESFLALIQNRSKLSHGEMPPGVCGRYDGRLVAGPQRTLLQGHEIPVSNRAALLDSPFEMARRWAGERYHDNFYNYVKSFEGRLATNAYISRGCSCNCAYCSPGSFWRDPISHRPCQRIKSLAVMEEELKYLRSKGYGALYFDEMAIPFQNREWALAFANLMHEYGFLWGGSVIFRNVKNLSLKELSEFGLRYLYFGYETPSAELQHAIRKETNEKEVLAFMEKAFSCGIQCDLSIFFGIPGESDDSIQRTIGWLNDNLPRGNAFFSVAALWPGTDWSKECDLPPLCWEPEFDKKSVSERAIWYSHEMTSVGQFFSNSLGTYHPVFMSEQKALWIKQMLIDSGFRKRFAVYSRSLVK